MEYILVNGKVIIILADIIRIDNLLTVNDECNLRCLCLLGTESTSKEKFFGDAQS